LLVVPVLHTTDRIPKRLKIEVVVYIGIIVVYSTTPCFGYLAGTRGSTPPEVVVVNVDEPAFLLPVATRKGCKTT
jgi:hypothetical protein